LPLAVYDKPLPIRKYVDLDPSPLYPFGYGLSYTKFRYSHLQIEALATGRDGALKVMVDIENAGDRKGDEAVLLFVRQMYSSVTRPLKMLKGFQRIPLGPGEKRTVRFTLPAQELALYDRDMRRVVEPGTFKVMVGGLEDTFEVTE
jgi:beta-glucosidase